MNAPIQAIGQERKFFLETSAIDPRAAISNNAEIGPGCTVGPFAVIGPEVRLGEGSVIHAHAVIDGPTILGPGNEVHAFACIGGPPQDLRYRGEPTELIVGRGNVFREHVTVNRGTTHGGGRTLIGDDNLFMAYTHVAHDCRVGNHVVMANNATVAGHTVIEDFAVFGGMVGVGTFLRIGESAMIAAGSMVEREVPPFCLVAGDRARLRAVNRVGMVRRGIGEEARRQIKAIFRLLKERHRSIAEIIEAFRQPISLVPEIQDGVVSSWAAQPLTPEAFHMLTFLENVTHGLTR